ncbi:hypothetical protein [Hyphomicrobium sp. MC8b]|uniref:hypothetical protein n=1 Tax=Hyphomicrobium sp. MC8b TaxID=300273 RepID=UPI0039190760
MRAALVISATLALAACAETKAPPPMVRERACSVLDPYTGRVSDIKPDDARVWTAGTNAALAELCKGETK